MKQVLLQRGRVAVDDVPAPQVEPGTALVAVRRSCISAGTELSGLRRSGLPLWRMALEYPRHAKKVVETTATLGVARTWNLVQGQLSAGAPTGYSAAGTILEVGPGLDAFAPGDRVACAGAQCAHHAEVIRVPKNLIVRVPECMTLDDASTVTLGAIALQGVRRAQPTLGEAFVVIGLGILGQITAQLLHVNGCRVIGVDLDEARLVLARELGMDRAIHPGSGSDIDQVARLTDGFGADGVILTAATASHEVVSTAFRMCRRKGRVVLVGDVGLHLDRADLYQKELDFFISCSYGPGRYDSRYEDEGLDYPIGYVRWSENRNMAEYLRLVAEGRVQVAPLVSATYPVEQADAAYAALQAEPRPLVVLLSYPDPVPGGAPATVVANPQRFPVRSDVVRLALIGAGQFAKGTHLPNLGALRHQGHLRAVISRSGANAVATARRGGAEYSGTDYRHVLDDPDIDAVIVATRHHQHASIALAALRAGKHVLVEKPLALTTDELLKIEEFFASADDERPVPILLTGFNRRFSPYASRMRQWIGGSDTRSGPMMLDYRMNAGHLPADHWVQGPEGGGRNLGEACHIYDLFTFFTEARVERIQTSAIRPITGHYLSQDNFAASVTFADGSVATLTYTALGSKAHPKERFEVFVDGKVLTLDDYRALTVAGASHRPLRTRLPQKGQKEELTAFVDAVRSGGEWPIPLWQQVQATQIALDVERALSGERG